MTPLDVGEPAALEAALDALPLDHWIDVRTNGETYRVQRVPGGVYLPGDRRSPARTSWRASPRASRS